MAGFDGVFQSPGRQQVYVVDGDLGTGEGDEGVYLGHGVLAKRQRCVDFACEGELGVNGQSEGVFAGYALIVGVVGCELAGDGKVPVVGVFLKEEQVGVSGFYFVDQGLGVFVYHEQVYCHDVKFLGGVFGV